MIAAVAGKPVLHGVWVVAWGSFVYGPQLVVCMLFAWAGCRRAHGDLLNWAAIGFLWSLLPFIGMIATWRMWRRAAQEAGDTTPPA